MAILTELDDKENCNDSQLYNPNRVFKAELTRRLKNAEKLKKKWNKENKTKVIDVPALRTNVSSHLSIVIGENKGMNLEKSTFNYAIEKATEKCIPRSWDNTDFRKIYTSKARNILGNLKNQNNTSLMPRIESKDIKISKFPFLSSHELFPSLRQPYLDSKELKMLRNMAWEASAYEENGMYQCKKCGKSKTTVFSLQTRGADEPMTNFITCMNCKNRWKD